MITTIIFDMAGVLFEDVFPTTVQNITLDDKTDLLSHTMSFYSDMMWFDFEKDITDFSADTEEL